MTWHTPEGDRVLLGAEAGVVRHALAYLVELLEQEMSGENDPWETDVGSFDRLSAATRLGLLAEVGHALLRDTTPFLPLTSIREATVMAIFNIAAQFVAVEIESEQEDDTQDAMTWRTLLQDAFHETGIAEELEEMAPSLRSQDLSAWRFAIEVLANRVLWDHDFEMEDLLLDVDPESNEALKDITGIDDEYYTSPPPDPRESELPLLKAKLEELTDDAG